MIPWIPTVILELIHASKPDLTEGLCLLDTEPTPQGTQLIHSSLANRYIIDEAIKFLTYQLPTVGYWPTVALTGNGELGFGSGEGA